MLPKNESPSLREFASTLGASEAVRAALERYERTGVDRPEDLRRILGDPAAVVEYGPGVVHKQLESPNGT
ncbi:MAG TPA: hypothetical protein PK867_21055 [Pirellulales bacterium]|nr:hypothetical protein [Pirellulales bacterium]